MTRRLALPLALSLVAASALGLRTATAEPPKAAAPAPAAAPTNCKAYPGGKCCDPAITAHLAKEAVYGACGETDATFLGENAGKDSCKFYFKVGAEKELDTYVEVYAPKQPSPPRKPGDPFFSWKPVGKAFYADRALSPKMAASASTKTGLYLAGKDYVVMVTAMLPVCTKDQAKKLALKMK